MTKVEMIGMVDADGHLVYVDECDSLCNGEYNGPVLWPSVALAQSANDGPLSEGYRYCRVTLLVETIEIPNA